MRRFNVTVNGVTYDVLVEEVGATAAAPAAAPAQAPVAAPVAAPAAPKAAAPAGAVAVMCSSCQSVVREPAKSMP